MSNLAGLRIKYKQLFFEMRNVQNQKSLRVFLRSFEEKFTKDVKNSNKVLTKQDLNQIAMNIIAQHSQNQQLKKDSTQKQDTKKELITIIHQNQEKIIQQQEEIAFMKRKMATEDQMTRCFIEQWKKEHRGNYELQEKKKFGKKEQNSQMQVSIPILTEIADFSLTESVLRSPCQDMKENENLNQTYRRYGKCSTSRSRLTKSRFLTSEYAQQVQPDEKEKVKALAKLRKLQKYVLEKQKSDWERNSAHYGISPTKKFYKEQNSNLKAIQANLETHLQMLEKFREVPSVESLVARQEALKKKQKILKDLSETLTKKELQLNKKETQYIKRLKSTKVL